MVDQGSEGFRRRRRRRQQHSSGPRARYFLIALGILTVVAIAATAVTGEVMLHDCSLSTLRPISLGENSFLFASDGTRLGAVQSTQNRQPLQLKKMSPWLPKAMVAIEDRRFYQHGGIDYQGIARAAWADVRAGRIVEGGSTITQELVRNLYIGHSKRTFRRKVREACLATKLEQQVSKAQILAAYLNEVFYGHHAYGAEAGAQTYFSTSARHLTLTQAALLAGLPQAPSTYDPLRHPDRAMARRNEVLRAMRRSGSIDAEQYAAAIAAPLGLEPGNLYTEIRHPNFFGYAQQQLTAEYGAKEVAKGGLRVRTTIDLRLQQAARQAMRSRLRERSDPASALVAIDPRNGAIRAMVSYMPNGQQLKFNLASQGHRTAGSAFKPFVLATAINEGISVESTMTGPSSLTIPDEACSTNGTLWDVHNYAGEYGGTMTLIDATVHSINTIFAQLVDEVGPANVIPIAHGMGIESELQPVCSITLGSQAVTPLEMTDAYATFAARGIHHPPHALQLVRGPDSQTLGTLQPEGTRALPQNTADLVTYALQRVVQYGTGTAAALDRPAAGKTGTAENFQDAWFCGYVPQLATCVWVGYPHAETPMYNVEGFSVVFGGSLPAEIWHDFMSVAVAKLPVKDFAAPTSFAGRYVHGIAYAPPPPTTTTTTTTTTGTGTSTTEPNGNKPAPPPSPPNPATTTAPTPSVTTAPAAPATTAPSAAPPQQPPPGG